MLSTARAIFRLPRSLFSSFLKTPASGAKTCCLLVVHHRPKSSCPVFETISLPASPLVYPSVVGFLVSCMLFICAKYEVKRFFFVLYSGEMES